MRLRNIPGSREAIASSDFVVHEDVMKEKRGCWKEVFGNDRPLYLEVGMGKGRFITQHAIENPDKNFIILFTIHLNNCLLSQLYSLFSFFNDKANPYPVINANMLTQILNIVDISNTNS